MRYSIDHLINYAIKRSKEPIKDSLYEETKLALKSQKSEKALFKDLLAPENMTLGYYSPLYQELNDEQRLALNHWIYFMHYMRISDGEEYVIIVNECIAQLLESQAPEISQLLRKENQEEVDHRSAFQLMREEFFDYYGFKNTDFPSKPLRKYLISKTFTKKVLDYFGLDFVVVYFLSRGIINHMGKGFEMTIARTDSETNQAIHNLSRQHTYHENHHTAVSHMLSHLAPQVIQQREKSHQLYQLMYSLLRKMSIRMTFNETVTKKQEANMSRVALNTLKPLKTCSKEFLEQLLKEHFSLQSGVEKAKSDYIPKPNSRIVKHAALSPRVKQEWVDWINLNRDQMIYFPEDLVLS